MLVAGPVLERDERVLRRVIRFSLEWMRAPVETTSPRARRTRTPADQTGSELGVSPVPPSSDPNCHERERAQRFAMPRRSLDSGRRTG
jgi:hypothetical protein